ncbi:MAG: protease complex subunit PrcB family protein [Bacillota bacterium]
MKRVLTLAVLVILILVLAAGLLVSGCGAPAKGPEKENGVPGNGKPGGNETAVRYEIIEEKDYEDKLPVMVRGDLSLLRAHKGYFVFSPPAYDTGGNIYLMISAGEKPTGGYSLTLRSLQKQNSSLYLEVEEKAPAKDEMVIQVLTYPTLVIKLDKAYDGYNLTGTDKESFPALSPEIIPQRKEARGTYNGQIDNNFIEISVDGTAGAYMLPEALSWVLAEMLNSGDSVVFTYMDNEHGQRIILEIDTAERAAMLRGVRGVFVGRIDNNSVEIKVGGNPAAYVPAEQILIGQFNDGDKVIFDYYEDRHGRRIINRMHKEN